MVLKTLGAKPPKMLNVYQENWPQGMNLTIKERTDSLGAKPPEIQKFESNWPLRSDLEIKKGMIGSAKQSPDFQYP